MRDALVALDLETTGLDPTQDAIIEIGAVRMVNGSIVDEFSALIDPGIPVPPYVTHLTGIRTEDLVGAPHIAAALPLIRDFVGELPIIAHNVEFDVSFFRSFGILQSNLRLDTYELAAVLLPRSARYNLNSLTSEMNIELEHAHRALDDARAAALLYWALWNRVLELPYSTLLEIDTAASGISWNAAAVFRQALRERAPESTSPTLPNLPENSLFTALATQPRPLSPNQVTEKLDIEYVAGLVGENGPLAHAMADYEYRPQQVEMTRAVADAFNASKHLMMEAGTGTGKSIAYLVPAITWATQNDERVLISTNTINLQEQLLNKDIPLLKDALGIPFQAAILKGRGNYLCPRRLAAMRRRRPTSADELRTLAKILVWLLECDSGEKSDISLRGPIEHTIWQQLSAQDEDCTLDRCSVAIQGACPFYKARKIAEAAHLLIVNHALLVSDANTAYHTLPDYRYLVIDEAHHLEDAVTQGMSFHIDEAMLKRHLMNLGSPSRGLLGELLSSTQRYVPEKEFKRLKAYVSHIGEATSLMMVHIEQLFKAAYHLVEDIKGTAQSDYNTLVLITQRHRSRPDFAQLQGFWSTLIEFFDVIADAMGQLNKALNTLDKYDIPGRDDLRTGTSAAARFLSDVRGILQSFIMEPDANGIYWLSLGQSPSSLTIHTAPLHIGPLVNQFIWQEKDSVVITSATLRTHDNFDFVRARLFADQVETLEVESPFNYQESTLVFIPEDIPEPNDRHAYQQAVEKGLIELAAALDGRVMALFTSYAQLRQTAQAITPRLALGGITVYDQSDGTSREALLAGFKVTEKSVLLGTRSFWEGVDIPGESLSALVIVRLPFTVPSDPIFAARAETYTDSFKEYALPDAILRFRQGFGRLIRTQADRGVAAIFDSRVISKGYGSAFLEALPDCTVQYGPLSMLPETAKNWLTRSTH